jgi:UDP-N-acetylmuramate dehydrogenase
MARPLASNRESLATGLKESCRGELRRDELLAAHTTFGVGGPADLFFLPADADDVQTAIPLIQEAGLPVLPLGGGTNMLVRKEGFRGLVVELTTGMTRIEVRADEVVAEAGSSLQVLSRRCQRDGRAGMEFGCGIPGTTGGAVRGNAGAFGGETLDRLVWLRGVRLRTGKEVRLRQSGITYGYRYTELADDLLILEAAFGVEEADPDRIRRKMDEVLSQRKESQPLWERNAGCIFKNPAGTSAGLLIDQAGCKGLRAGGVEVSDVHANFMVNLGNGAAEDVLSLIDQVRKRVRSHAGIELEAEVRVIGEGGIERV